MPNLATSVITGSPSVAKSVFLRNYFRQGFSSFNDTNYLTILLKYRFWLRKYRQGWDFAFFLLFSVWGVKFKGILTLISYILRHFTGRSHWESLTEFPRLGLHWWSCCFSFPNSWDYRCAPSRPSRVYISNKSQVMLMLLSEAHILTWRAGTTQKAECFRK